MRLGRFYSWPLLKEEKNNRVLLALIVALYILTQPYFAAADTTEIVPLSFGRFVIADNNSVSTLTVYHDGRNPRANNNIYPIEQGTAGEYFLFNFPPFTPLTITIISTDDVSTAGPTEAFNVGSFTYEDVTTDSNGEATLIVGATLSSTGSGTGYVNSDYSANYIINISF